MEVHMHTHSHRYSCTMGYTFAYRAVHLCWTWIFNGFQ